MTSYSLWDQPWIPVRPLAGPPKCVSIREALVDARQLREVYDPSPLITVAIHRLLLAVLYRVFRPATTAEWVELWRAGQFDADRLDAYGAQWADRFDLFHPTRPFYQVGEMADAKVHPITALMLEAASGNNPTLFDHGAAEGADSLPPDRAACHLLAHQLFAVGGGVSKPFNRMDGPLTKGLVVEARGGDLFETLLLNLMPLEWWRRLLPMTAADAPFWEVETPPEPQQSGTKLQGPLQYLTWQSRQIHLGRAEGTDRVNTCQINQRYCLPKEGKPVDPGKVYLAKEKEGWQPFKLDKERAAWQFTHVLLEKTNESSTRPLLTDWLAEVEWLRRHEALQLPAVIELTVSGLTTDPMKAAKIELWRREQLPVPAVLLTSRELVDQLHDLLTYARRAESLLRWTGQTLVWALAEPQHLAEAMDYFWTGQGKVPDGIKKMPQSLGLVTRFWPALEGAFRQAVADLGQKETAVVTAAWTAAVQHAAGGAFRTVRDSLLHAEASFEALSRIDHGFHARLTRLKIGEADDKKEATTQDADADE